MIWWVYQQVRKSKALDEVYVAIDNLHVQEACDKWDIPTVMTKTAHDSHINRLHEVSDKVSADLYVCVCADEPLIKTKTVEQVIPNPKETDPFIARTLMRELKDPAETIDPSNIKLVADPEGYALLVTRSAIPNPYKSTQFLYKKVVGIECYNKIALDFFANTPPGELERIEGTNLLRFIEYRKPFKCILTKSYQLSVDTTSDFEKVRTIMQKMLLTGELTLE
jgi:3-deoxy-manno-octulosonate cytidylyltransferase (CMP-KDO synthetase)